MWMLAVFVISLVVAFAMMPKPTTPSPSTLDDANVPTAEPGRPIPVVFGTVLLKSPNVVWYGDFGYEAVQR